MYNLSTTQKAAQIMKTTLGSILFALAIVFVHFLAWALATYAPILTIIVLAGLLTWLLLEAYIGLRNTLG